MSSSMWYIMQSIQSKYSLSERLIRTIAAIRSFPHDNVEDLIRGVSVLYWRRSPWGGKVGKFLGNPNGLQIRSSDSAQDHKEF